jgi:hypothetical protein
MRLIAVLLLPAGLALALLGPLVWVGRLPVVLGAVCVLVAALLAARQTQRVWLPVGGLVLAALLFLAPGLVNSWRNGRGIAWEVPEGEHVELAADGYAITSDTGDSARTESPALIGRDIDSGAQRWRVTLPESQEPAQGLSVDHVGRTLLVVDRRDGVLYGFDLGTGKRRWATPPADRTYPEITDGQTIATLRCDAGNRCRVEARSLADGALRWSAPAAQDNSFLGAPRLTRDSSELPPVWHASFVIVHLPSDRERYQARDLGTGRVLAAGSTKRTDTASIGDVFLRAGDKTVTATEVDSGRVLWRRPTRDGVPVGTVDLTSRMIAVIDGGLLLASDLYSMPNLPPGDPLRILDPRSGKVTEHPVGVTGYVGVFATGTATPGVPLLRKFGDTNPEDDSAKDQLVVDGRHYLRERLDPFEVAATTTQAGFKSTLPVYGLGKRRAIEVYDRRGGPVARLVERDAHVRSAGERLVITVGAEEDQRSFVVRGR